MTLHEPQPAPRLPGVYIETVAPPRADTLPRMDIAAFVGFAAAGPIDRPVPVEDISRFRDIFGPDLLLARDAEKDSDQFSLLGPAVEAFFANGGQRAFVVRVADAQTAATIQFPIPGLVSSLDPTDGAMARARAPGMWPAGFAADPRWSRRTLLPTPGTSLVAADGVLTLPLAIRSHLPAPGDLIEATFEAAGLIALIAVDRISATTVIARDVFWRMRGPSSPLAQGAIGIDDDGLVAADPTAVDTLLATDPGVTPSSLSLLTFDLVLWNGRRIAYRLNDLAFCSGHPRYWATLPDDAALFGELFGRPARRQDAQAARFRTDITAPRFPLAGPEEPATTIWLPDAMKTRESRSNARAPNLPATGRLAAEGLLRFSDSLFVDGRFARLTTDSLVSELEARYAMALEQSGPALRGIHSLLPLQEVAMIAVPDAVHRPWTDSLSEGPAPLTAPLLDPLPRSLDPFDRVVLTWTAVAGAQTYRVELGTDTTFTSPTVTYTSDPQAFLSWENDCPAFAAARVRAERPGEIGPWSNTRASFVPEETFEDCAFTDPDLLSLVLTVQTAPTRLLSWAFETGALEPGDAFELQSGLTATLDDGAAVAIDPAAQMHEPDPIVDLPRYFRVRVRRGDATGPWSATMRIDPTGRSSFALLPATRYADDPDPAGSGQGQLTAIHRAMIRFAAARGDMVALLSLPQHFETRQVQGQLARLSPRIDDIAGGDDDPMGDLLVPGLRFGEEAALSYAAMQHPWLATVDATTQAFQPPDGFAAGLIAKRANGPGVWIASANQTIAGGIALSPRMEDDAIAQLIAQQVNVLRRDPRGFLIFNAETLSTAYEWSPLPVRLLMILLRRLALREGRVYVFEPHSADFRAQVRRRFERMLSQIHERGGFAGDTPAQSFQVVTGDSVNPPGDVALGRFVTELRVAPSRPFRYINIRLLRTGAEQLSVEERA